MDVRWNRPSKAGLRRQRSCGNIEGLARTCSDHNNERGGKWLEVTDSEVRSGKMGEVI
jgi:hypothetical protein